MGLTQSTASSVLFRDETPWGWLQAGFPILGNTAECDKGGEAVLGEEKRKKLGKKCVFRKFPTLPLLCEASAV